ncbi:MAG: methionine gamma-lyase family protein [Clostridia bacterium]|nr:methionine gamma-lyase family protein [Clostridia bacterium]
MMFSKKLAEFIETAEDISCRQAKKFDQVSLYNQEKVLEGFKAKKINHAFFQGSTGYGYDDLARDGLEDIYAHVFKAERALIRSQIASGTHAISCCLFGLLRPGDWLLSLTGSPYDTLQPVIGHKDRVSGSLAEFQVNYAEVPLNKELKPDIPQIIMTVSRLKPKVVMIQRSRGYQWRPSISIDEIGQLIRLVKENSPNTICFVDNCYGEFVEKKEPIEVGADLIAGSLIKNPGGGMVPAGGYIVGKSHLVEQASYRLTAPGIGAKVGATLITPRLLYQGFFMAPHIVKEALISATYGAALFNLLGFDTDPTPEQYRTDIIQAVKLGSKKLMLLACKALQEACPIDSYIYPEPSEMAGYSDEVVMAGGTFVQGSSIELSADGPIKSPFVLYFQGALTSEHGKLAMGHVAKIILTKNFNNS